MRLILVSNSGNALATTERSLPTLANCCRKAVSAAFSSLLNFSAASLKALAVSRSAGLGGVIAVVGALGASAFGGAGAAGVLTLVSAAPVRGTMGVSGFLFRSNPS